MLRRTFSQVMPIRAAPPSGFSGDQRAVAYLGRRFADQLETEARAMDVSSGTLLIWAWGQALLRSSGAEILVVEQVRSGVPQEGTAGFTMNLLPVLIRKAGMENIGALRTRLLALRRFEALSAEDFPPGVFPDVIGPWSSVIMVEHGTLRHAADVPDCVEMLKLHERPAESLMATAYLRPDLRLEVEGPGRHGLLEGWIEVLTQLRRGIHAA